MKKLSFSSFDPLKIGTTIQLGRITGGMVSNITGSNNTGKANCTLDLKIDHGDGTKEYKCDVKDAEAELLIDAE